MADFAYTGNAWKKRRADWQRHLEVVGPIVCRQCGEPVTAAQAWDLGHGRAHAEGGRGDDARPEHRRCNRAAGGRLGHERQSRPRSSREW